MFFSAQDRSLVWIAAKISRQNITQNRTEQNKKKTKKNKNREKVVVVKEYTQKTRL